MSVSVMQVFPPVFVNMNKKYILAVCWGPLEMAEGRGPLGNRHPAPRLLRPVF